MVHCVTAVECNPATVKTAAFVILAHVINKLMIMLMLETAPSLGQESKTILMES